ncbi:MAG: hypothetical protein ACRBB4_09885 [Neptuniibacter sp.]
MTLSASKQGIAISSVIPELKNPVKDDHDEYIMKALCRHFYSLLSTLPEDQSDSIFFKVAELEKEKASDDAFVIYIMNETFNGIKRDNKAFRAKLDEFIGNNKEKESCNDFDSELTTDEVINLTGMSRSTLQKLTRTNALIAYRPKGAKKNIHPAWQFNGKKTIDGLDTILEILDFNGEEAARILTSEHYGKRSIAKMLYDRDIDGAIRGAELEMQYRSMTSDASRKAADDLFCCDASELNASFEPGRTEVQ